VTDADFGQQIYDQCQLLPARSHALIQQKSLKADCQKQVSDV
jgi:hypothetical protein